MTGAYDSGKRSSRGHTAIAKKNCTLRTHNLLFISPRSSDSGSFDYAPVSDMCFNEEADKCCEAGSSETAQSPCVVLIAILFGTRILT